MESVDCQKRREANHKNYVVDNWPSQKNMSHTRSTVAKGRFLSLNKNKKNLSFKEAEVGVQIETLETAHLLLPYANINTYLTTQLGQMLA